jgi:hypothetical protein
MHGPQQSSAEKLAEARSRAVDALLVKHGIRPRRKRAKRTQPPSNIEREVGVDVGIVRRTFGSVLRVS